MTLRSISPCGQDQPCSCLSCSGPVFIIPSAVFLLPLPAQRDRGISPPHRLWMEAQNPWHFPSIRQDVPSQLFLLPLSLVSSTQPAKQRMSQIVAQRPLPSAPEPGGRIPTIAPMELTEQDTSRSQSARSHLPPPRDAPRALGGRIRPSVSPTTVPKPAREVFAFLPSSCSVSKRQSQ